jgi:hypothetical protein
MTQNGRFNYEEVTGSKQKFLFIFLTFGRDTTNYRDTLVENVKKSKFNPPYCIPVYNHVLKLLCIAPASL